MFRANIIIAAALLSPLALGQENATEATAEQPVVDAELRDYSENNFAATLRLLRAGAHDETGINDYYFTAKLHGVVNTAEQRKKPFAEQRKITRDIEPFGQLTVPSLEYWRADPKSEPVEIQISGDQIRELIAEVMKTEEVLETQVAVRMDLELWEVEKKFVFFGEDTPITSVFFYPIPQTKFDTPARTNLNLEMRDEKGALVQFAIEYKNPLNSAKK